MYCTVDEVYGTAGITSDQIEEKYVEQFIRAAEADVDRFTNTTYLNLKTTGTSTAGGNTILFDDSVTWTINEYSDMHLWITSGTGIGQIRKIASNTATTATITSAWTTNPGSDSVYRIIYSGTNPYIESESQDGDDTRTLYLDKYPLLLLESVTSNSTSVTPSNLYQYKYSSRLLIGTSTAEVSTWTSKAAQQNIFTYYYGVYPIPEEIKRLTIIYAGLKCLQAQMGGTHNIPSTYSLPEGSVTIGQAYINIKTTWDVLARERSILEARVIKYVSAFA